MSGWWLVTMVALAAALQGDLTGTPGAARPPAEAQAPLQADPVLSTLRDQLEALDQGKLHQGLDLDALFSTPTTDPIAVGARVKDLDARIKQTQTNLTELGTRLDRLPEELPQPSLPPELAAAPEEPPAPAEPTCTSPAEPTPPADLDQPPAPPPAAPIFDEPRPVDPVEPSKPRPTKGRKRASRPALRTWRADHRAWTAAHAAWQQADEAWSERQAAHATALEGHRKAQAEFEQAAAAHAARRTAYDTARNEADKQRAACSVERDGYAEAAVRYRDALKAYATQRAAYDAGHARHEAALADLRERTRLLDAQLRTEQADARLRLDVDRRRKRLLLAIGTTLKRLPGPALRSLQGIARRRASVRAQAVGVGALAEALADLQRRLQLLSDRVAAGALIGFMVERDELLHAVDDLLHSTSDRLRRVEEVTRALMELADRLERDGSEVQRSVLSAAMPQTATASLDAPFRDHLAELRRLRKTAGREGAQDPTDFDLPALEKRIAGALAEVANLGSMRDATRRLEEVRAALEEVDRSVTGIHLGMDRWALAFEREAVTLLSELASTATREEAYALSTEMLADVRAEVAEGVRRAQAWATGRLDSLHRAPEILRGLSATVVLRFLLALSLILGAFALRGRVPRAVSRVVRSASRARWIRASTGTVVRVAGLAQTVLPVAVAAAVGYLALALVGMDLPEVRIAEVIFRWALLYILGRQILLGLTRRISRGRPAILNVSEPTVLLLRRTYLRGGLVLAVGAVIIELIQGWLGSGLLTSLVRWLIWGWFGTVWCLWAAVVWRERLARRWASVASLAWEQRAAAWMGGTRLGFVLSPVAAGRLAWTTGGGVLRQLMAERGLTGWLRARSLKRMAAKVTEEISLDGGATLPERYIREFPLYPIQGEDGPLVLARYELTDKIAEQVTGWRTSHRDGSLLLTGEKGIGKTTLLAVLARRLAGLRMADDADDAEPLRVTQHTIAHKVITTEALVRDLAGTLDAAADHDLDSLVESLLAGPERVLLLDDAHNVFLRTVDGYRGFDALVSLVSRTRQRVFWVLVFDRFAWRFLRETRARDQYFRRRLQMPDWSSNEISDLISRRNSRTGMTLHFDQLLLDEGRSSQAGFQLIESSEGYFRLLHAASGGNPRIATWLWLQSLRVEAADKLKVGLFGEPPPEALENLDPELLFALAAVCQHENLSAGELQQALNVDEDFALFALSYLREVGFVEPKHTDPERMTLAPPYYLQVLRTLRSRHLLFE